MDTIRLEKSTHQGHRDALVAFFQEHVNQVVTWELLERLVGRNYQQRISDARRQLGLNIENVPRLALDGKRLTGDYRFRPLALGRDAADLVAYVDQPLFGQPSGWQR